MRVLELNKDRSTGLVNRLTLSVLVVIVGIFSLDSEAQAQGNCARTLTADVVAFDMPLMWNRFGAQNINGMMFALRRDVVSKGSLEPIGAGGAAGDVTLRPDKRPRPLVLRMGAGDCLEYTVTNLLDIAANPFEVSGGGDPALKDPKTGCSTTTPPTPGEVRSNIGFNCSIDDQVEERRIGLNFQGTELVTGIADDSSNVGANESSLIPVGQSRTYKIRAQKEGSFVGTSYGATFGGEGLNGMMANGLWAVLNVGPKDSAFYRSQVTREEMDLSTTGFAPSGHPIVAYESTYPGNGADHWAAEGKAGLPILNMVQGYEIVHSDINAMVVYGPAFTIAAPADGGQTDGKAGHFPMDTYPLESKGMRNPTVPNRLEPFREVTVAFHDEVTTKQAFPKWFEDPVLGHTLHGVRDSFMINYGSGGIGSEIIASRLRVGPPHDCVNCAYEEFFLTAYTVADVAMLADIPANFGLEDCEPTLAGCEETGPKANYTLFPDDPSNVHHSYTGEFVKMRNIHAGPGEQHVFHQHNHQWLYNANDDNSNYLDAQGLGPGSGYSYEFNFGGAGNRNKTAGDAIFHCHFYPHFAQGMWEMWRIHDTFEMGTELAVNEAGPDGILYDDPDTTEDETLDNGLGRVSFIDDGLGAGNGKPAAGARALPDPEIVAGTPIPAVVPLPGRPMAPMPVDGVTVKANPTELCVGDAPTFGLAARNADGNCPVGYNSRPVGSLADVPAPLDADFGEKTAGYPFWVAGIEHTVGNRPPTPPLDMITSVQAFNMPTYDPTATLYDGKGLWSHSGFSDPNSVDGWDGGLPRFSAGGYAEGSEAVVSVLEARLDLSKEVTKLKPYFYPEQGTELEKAAMAYHAVRNHASCLPDGTCDGDVDVDGGINDVKYVLNGARPVPGAPYQEPCIDDKGALMQDGHLGEFFDGQFGLGTRGKSPFTADNPRVYKGANVQIDAVFNKIGYHYPQQRIIALWDDVVPSVTKERPPEPLVMRINTFDCTQYVHSNVVPKVFELDDYQVRTPTDIIGQHIHLPKWDLTTADGAANGWNYEDGTLSPGAVVEWIEAINHYNETAVENGLVPVYEDIYGQPVEDSSGHSLTTSLKLEPSSHPYWAATPYGACGENPGPWCGARATIQRWFADPVVNVQGVDRGLGIIFSHDHYGPSTHQQVGLYSTVLIEPAGSKWLHNETGEQLATRHDGGPTTWQAAILTGTDGIEGYDQNVGAENVENHREFYFEYSDFQHAYQPDIYVGSDEQGFPKAEYLWNHQDNIAIGGPGQFINQATFGNTALTAVNQPGAIGPDPDSFRDAVQPAFRQQAQPTTAGNGPAGFEDFPTDIWVFPDYCPHIVDGVQVNDIPRPCPEAISADDPGMYVVNYRNESLAARVFDPNRDDCPDDSGKSDGLAEHGGCQAKHKQGDLAYAMASNPPGGPRKIPELNDRFGKAPASYDGNASGNTCGNGIFCPGINDSSALSGGDPFTPMMRTYEGDRVHVKIQAGAHEEEHSVSVHGLKWLQAGSAFGEAKNSGWRNSQPAGISEQFSFTMPVLPDKNQTGGEADYAYNINSSLDGWVSGTWGILRSYQSQASGQLAELPNNPKGKVSIENGRDFNGVCPKSSPVREYDITAILAEDALYADETTTPFGITIQDYYPNSTEGRSPAGPGTLVYNTRTSAVAGTVDELGNPVSRGGTGALHDPTAILYLDTQDLVARDAFIDSYKKKGQYVYFWNSNDARCINGSSGVQHRLPGCPVKLKPAEPYVDTNGNGSYDDGESFTDVAWTKQATIAANGVYDKLKTSVDPMVVRAAAGDCMEISLRNKLLAQAKDNNGNYVYSGSGSKHVFEDLGETVYNNKGLLADTDNDSIGDTPVAYADVSFDRMPDLATGNATQGMVRRDKYAKANPGLSGTGVSTFQTNLMAPSACVGLHAALVDFDVTRSDGTVVGKNSQQNIVCPDQVQSGSGPTYRWYAGHIEPKLVSSGGKQGKKYRFEATPIEFGGFNITPADKIEQGQKAAIGAGVIYPQGSEWEVDEDSSTSATICDGLCKADGSNAIARDFVVVAQKGASMFYADSFPVENILGEGTFGVAEDAQDMGHMAINFGTEPLWYRFGVNPTDDEGFMEVAAGDAYDNDLAGEDPQTGVFIVTANMEFRQHVLMPFGPGRGSTFNLHGHSWQRDPYICDSSDLGLVGKCDTGDGYAGIPKDPMLSSGEVGSRELGVNPIGMEIGGIESWFPTEHYEIFIPSAGGQDGVVGDYLFRDHMGLGNAQGLWGIVRVK